MDKEKTDLKEILLHGPVITKEEILTIENRSSITQIPKPKFGSAKGFFKINDDFDESLEDFKDYISK